MSTTTRCVLLAFVAVLAVPAAAGGGIASVSDSAVSFVAGDGEANDLVVTRTTTGLEIVDRGAPVTPGAGCTAVSPAEVFCPLPSASPGLDFRLGDMDDRASYDHLETWAYIHTSGPTHTFAGGDGNDTLDGDGVALLQGGPGSDVLSSGRLDGGPGADFLGGPGSDVVTYASRVNPVTVTTDGIGNDGESGEGDQVATSVEMIVGGFAGDTIVASRDVYGGPGNDSLTGGPETQSLWGGAGNDRIRSGAGQDVDLYGEWGDDRLIGSAFRDDLYGGRGNDALAGRGNRDLLFGGPGDDLIRGGGGSDVLSADAGRDRLFGERGNDRLFAQDRSRDRVDGGAGRDRARVNNRDTVWRVEFVRRFPP
jgi:Ca2+-binding RTX toxin-like protein